jgi:flagellar motor switch protein FliG
MSNLSERARAVLMEDISVMARVPLRDVEAAQQEIVEIIRRMEEAGDIVIRKEEEEYV